MLYAFATSAPVKGPWKEAFLRRFWAIISPKWPKNG
jgi:hypothetical protein